MELTKERAKENLAELIDKFERELSAGRIKEYNEEATKTAFIQPLLKDVLGWDVNDRDEVSPEENISRGRVDYGLKVEGKIKVFIEAKPPKADLSKHVEQAVRYGYNRKGVPFVLLTDFEELKLFDVTVKPDTRNPLKGLKIDLHWNQYLPQFEKIWCLSKESVIQGELDKLLLVKPKERLSVDKAILDDLKRWREVLAKDIFKNNRQLFHSADQEKDANYLKEITQGILDRIIFMRSCEDRGLIYRRPLKELFEERTETVGTNTMIFLKEEFKHYNIIFDSDMFRPQEWEGNLAIDFKVMRDIVLETYNPYQFDVIPLEVLGNIYEQYLGYTIRLTDHQVRYELKPEVRKAGGVYYTPEYIVDYIVRNTVGKLLHELSPRKIKRLRILDPACGSGSFLIRAYEEMLNYYREQKKQQLKSKEEQQKLDLRQEEAEPRLTIYEKSEILRNHIFGVDIDEQAVEVTKLSLMLKMLEGEYGIIPGRAILPMLDQNIKCGNSLISGDTLELKKYFGDDWYKVKPFNWSEEFRMIMIEEGGFDVVIGNPPWGAEFSEPELAYHRQKNKEIIVRMIDSFMYFVYQGCKRLKVGGRFGMILPDVVFYQQDNENLRKFVLRNFKINFLLNMGDVFEKVTRPTSILILERRSSFSNKIKVSDFSNVNKSEKPLAILDDKHFDTILQKNILKIPGALFVTSKHTNYAIWRKVKDIPHKLLKDLVDEDGIQRGVSPDLKKAFIIESNMIRQYNLETNKLKRVLTGGKQVKRYHINYPDFWLIYTTHADNFRNLPHICAYIDQFKNEITCIEVKQNKHSLYSLHRPRKEKIFLKNKKLVGVITEDEIILALDNAQSFTTDGLYLFNARENINLNYLMALLNSKLFVFIYRMLAFEKGRVLAQVKPTILNQLPIRNIDFSNAVEGKFHDDLVVLVDVMLDLNKKIQTAKGSEKEQIQRQIEKADKEIDDLVYKIYGITEEEKKIIEGKGV
jgi:type I restriction-modification system DNA methylase subunit